MALTNREFAQRAGLICKRSATWAHETMTLSDADLAQPADVEAVGRFCREIKEMLDRIHPLARSD